MVDSAVKPQYRIQLLVMFLLMGGTLFLLSQPFFAASNGIEIKGFEMLLALPFKFFGEAIPEFAVSLLPQESLPIILALGGESFSLSSVLTFGLSAGLLFTVLIIVLSALSALLRLIFNKPYRHSKRRFLFLTILNVLMTGLCIAVEKVEFLKALMGGDNAELYGAMLFYYIFTGGTLLLYIMSFFTRKN